MAETGQFLTFREASPSKQRGPFSVPPVGSPWASGTTPGVWLSRLDLGPGASIFNYPPGISGVVTHVPGHVWGGIS